MRKNIELVAQFVECASQSRCLECVGFESKAARRSFHDSALLYSFDLIYIYLHVQCTCHGIYMYMHTCIHPGNILDGLCIPGVSPRIL